MLHRTPRRPSEIDVLAVELVQAHLVHEGHRRVVRAAGTTDPPALKDGAQDAREAVGAAVAAVAAVAPAVGILVVVLVADARADGRHAPCHRDDRKERVRQAADTHPPQKGGPQLSVAESVLLGVLDGELPFESRRGGGRADEQQNAEKQQAEAPLGAMRDAPRGLPQRGPSRPGAHHGERAEGGSDEHRGPALAMQGDADHREQRDVEHPPEVALALERGVCGVGVALHQRLPSRARKSPVEDAGSRAARRTQGALEAHVDGRGGVEDAGEGEQAERAERRRAE